jgi:hypothetical protein
VRSAWGDYKVVREKEIGLFRAEKGDSVKNGGATNQKGSKGGQKRIALNSVDLDEAKAQKDKNTKT